MEVDHGTPRTLLLCSRRRRAAFHSCSHAGDIAQPVQSTHVQALEKELGVQFLTRATRKGRTTQGKCSTIAVSGCWPLISQPRWRLGQEGARGTSGSAGRANGKPACLEAKVTIEILRAERFIAFKRQNLS